MAAKQTGRRPKAEGTKEILLKFSVEPHLHAYLVRLADTKWAASSPSQMARLVLIEALEQRRKDKYLGVAFDPSSPQGDG